VVGVLAETLQDTYLRYKTAKEMWDTLNTKYGGLDAGTELYIIEKYHDYHMVDGKSVVTKAHEIQCMVKELALLKIVIPDEFVARGIIAKLSPLWRDFITVLRHKRVHMTISDLIASLDAEEKARAEDGQSKGAKGQTNANMVHQPQSHGKGKGKAKNNQNNNKPKQTTTFKKKKNNKEDEGCFMYGFPGHWAKKCPNHKGRKPQPEQKTTNMVVSSSGGGTSGYGNLPYIFKVFQSTTWWLDSGVNNHVCSDASLFSSYHVTQDSSVMMGNGSHASVHSVVIVDLKLTSGKIVQLRNAQHVPSINKNLVSGSLLCRDGFKAVLESNKFVMSKCGQFIGKGYVCEGLFRFSVSDFCNKYVNNICDGINESDASICHSRLCYLNFGYMSRLSSLNLILNLSIIKASKCQSCVQSKQP
jgi:hypothetical protein